MTKIRSKQLGEVDISKLSSPDASATKKHLVYDIALDKFIMTESIVDENWVEDVNEQLDGKVDKVTGKGLSTNDYTTDDKAKLAALNNYDDTALSNRIGTIETNYVTSSTFTSSLSNKVDKVAGKGLSTNDYSNEDKLKLAGLFNYNDTSLSNRIGTIEANYVSTSTFTSSLSNKVDKEAGKGLSTNDYTATEKAKVALINNSGAGDLYLANNGNYQAVGTRKVTYSQRVSLTGVIDGDKVYQTNNGKGEYVYHNSTWFYVGDPLESRTISASSTINIEDIGYHLLIDSPTDLTITIPPSLFKKGHQFLLTQMGIGKIKLEGGIGITLAYPATFGLDSYEQYAQIRVKFITDTIVLIDGLTN